LENLVKMGTTLKGFGNIFNGRKVLVTGHTGFKGAWLSEWLLGLGAKVYGVSLNPPTSPSLYDQLNLKSRLVDDARIDLADLGALVDKMKSVKPDFVLHLAAQPLVRLSYQVPVETFKTNVLGSIHLLEAVRQAGMKCSVVMVTTDKCYENQEWLHGYRETDRLGGHDPYSASKAAAEIAVASYRSSFFSEKNAVVRVATCRAGNVIGGGDWAMDRIIPDCIRSLQAGLPVAIRNKTSTRPWQHVLEPLSGYLWVAALLDQPELLPGLTSKELTGAFNFGPELSSNKTVLELVEAVFKDWPGTWDDKTDPQAVHEAGKLNLSTDKAFHLLNWKPVWDFNQTVHETTSWYKKVSTDTTCVGTITLEQINLYTTLAGQKNISWATR